VEESVMAAIVSREIQLKSRPVGLPREENFELVEVTLPPLQEGEVVVCNAFMSVDPYRRDPAVRKRLTMQGFIVSDHLDRLSALHQDMKTWIQANQIRWEETVVDGLENAPKAFIGLFTSDNMGKMLVRLHDEA
jgi:NADPH-dependent curcumin reductase CurA